MTHCQKVLELLSDGREHSHHELYALNVVAHSRVAELRKRGHVITCKNITDLTGQRVSVYQLHSLSSPAGTPNDWGRTVPAGGLSEVGTPDPGSANPLKPSASLASSSLPERELHSGVVAPDGSEHSRSESEVGRPVSTGASPASLASDDSDEQLSIFEAAA